MDVRAAQAPLKERYWRDPGSARIKRTARASEGERGRAADQLLRRCRRGDPRGTGVCRHGGPGIAACSGDLLLGALAACAQVTCHARGCFEGGHATRSIAVIVEGELLDLRVTLGVDRDAPVGFERIERFEIDALGVSREQIALLVERAERYCVVLQTLVVPPPVDTVVVSR